MKLAYYPGCSLHSTAKSYDESIRAVAGLLGLELVEVDDWNCCGATAYMNVNEILALTLSARNLAIVKETGLPLTAPCSACYTNLQKAERYMAAFPDVKRKVDEALAEGGMTYDGGVSAKHFLQTVVDDVGLDRVRSLVKHPLEGLRVAPYYGCQIARPFNAEGHGDTDDPVALDHLLAALGAVPIPYAMKTVCCGGSLMGTREEVALKLCKNILLCAEQGHADCIAVTCPLCQMNLDVYQHRVNKSFGTAFAIPIVYFTQLMGLAFGVGRDGLGLARHTVATSRIAAASAAGGAA